MQKKYKKNIKILDKKNKYDTMNLNIQKENKMTTDKKENLYYLPRSDVTISKEDILSEIQDWIEVEIEKLKIELEKKLEYPSGEEEAEEIKKKIKKIKNMSREEFLDYSLGEDPDSIVEIDEYFIEEYPDFGLNPS